MKKKLIKKIEELLNHHAIKDKNGYIHSSMNMLSLAHSFLIIKDYPVCRIKIPTDFYGLLNKEDTLKLVQEIKDEYDLMQDKACKRCTKKNKELAKTIIPPVECKKD